MKWNMNEIDGFGTWPEFEKRLDFYIPLDAIFVELNCSNEVQKEEGDLGLGGQPFVWLLAIPIIDSRMNFVNGSPEYEETKELADRLGEYEQEIYGKDLLIQHLQKETGIHGETFEK